MTHENKVANQTKGANQPKEANNPNVTTKCLSIIEYKGNAIYELVKTIPIGEDRTTESPGKTLESYISMLNDWNCECTLSDADEQWEVAQDGEQNTDTGVEIFG